MDFSKPPPGFPHLPLGPPIHRSLPSPVSIKTEAPELVRNATTPGLILPRTPDHESINGHRNSPASMPDPTMYQGYPMQAHGNPYISSNVMYPGPVGIPIGPEQQQQFAAQDQRQYQGQPYHPGAGYHGYQRGGATYHFNRKRMAPQEYKTSGKKKKKPLSQNVPAKKDWTLEDAQKAMDLEMDYNRRNKNPSLIIKFPDLPLNREIVSKFHPEIESVHFQQPSTPRFCFVTLKNASLMNQVIDDISKVEFGSGYLSAEPKNTKEDDLVKRPEDIDPLTLYVGNLAQEVTVEDVVRTYPNHKRIDIGFAKKMKYTRYAFVSFRNVEDAMDAFQDTHGKEMYNKSLIVRFRRLHGTVGLPGDPKAVKPNTTNVTENDTANSTGTSRSTNGAFHIKEEFLSDEDEEFNIGFGR